MLWAYGLVFALYLITGSFNFTLWIALPFTALTECLQLFFHIPGTFDIWDLITMLITQVIALLIIYFKINHGGLNDEKEN